MGNRQTEIIMRIHTKPVTGLFHICCPSCGNHLLEATETASKVPDGGYIIQDGDNIFGVWEALSETERLRGWDAALCVGTCRSCGERYYFANLGFSEAPLADVQEYLHLNVDPGPETNYICSIDDGNSGTSPDWLMHEWNTQDGLVQHHYLGPWPLTYPEDVENENGVSACAPALDGETHWDHATRVSLAAWTELRRICAQHTMAKAN